MASTASCERYRDLRNGKSVRHNWLIWKTAEEKGADGLLVGWQITAQTILVFDVAKGFDSLCAWSTLRGGSPSGVARTGR